MNATTLVLLGPLIAVGAAVVVLMIAVSIRRSHHVTAGIALAGLLVAFLLLFRTTSVGPRGVGPLLLVDEYAIGFTGLILAATAAVALLAVGYLDRLEDQRDEYYMLLLLAALGSIVLVSAAHFASFFLGLELLSVSLYGLIAYPRTRAEAVEAGLKYLILAAASAAFLLFGMALVYARLGTMEFARMSMTAADRDLIALGGVGLIVVGFGFKLALVPFHLWTPDVYQGAPAPTTAFVSTVSKGAMLALLLRYLPGDVVRAHRALLVVFTLLAIASMAGGNLLALQQRNVKRLLAYSSIAHLGYLIVAFLAGGDMAAAAVAFYLAAYFVTMLGAFGVVAVLSTPAREAGDIDDYRGLAARRPWLAMVLTAALLSLAGIPLTAGFVGKFYVTVAAGSAALWALLIVMMVTSGIGLFYYLRVVVAMYMEPAAGGIGGVPAGRAPLAGGLALAALTVLLVWLGIYPGPLVAFIRAAVAGVA
ncbi:MAG: NADH-quinone oxidoreductase subunit N [Acidobacteria bacterium]|nr:NADH-quinone oxidoreductase subunit N [Acidobacteriota bacterium]